MYTLTVYIFGRKETLKYDSFFEMDATLEIVSELGIYAYIEW